MHCNIPSLSMAVTLYILFNPSVLAMCCNGWMFHLYTIYWACYVILKVLYNQELLTGAAMTQDEQKDWENSWGMISPPDIVIYLIFWLFKEAISYHVY